MKGNLILFNLPNRLTIARIILIPVFLVLLISNIKYGQWMALAVFAVMAATDGLDGYVARARKQETRAGKFLDPFADKLVTAAALIGLVEIGELPSWIAIIIIGREFVVSGLRIALVSKGIDLPASKLGKVKTLSQITAIFLWIMKLEISNYYLNITAWVVMVAALLLTIYSGLDYFVNLKGRLSKE